MKKLLGFLTIFLWVSSVLAQPCAGGGSVMYVNIANTSPGNGSSWATAYNNLSDALSDANSCSNITQIWVAQGTYIPSRNSVHQVPTNPRSASFPLRSGLAIYGGFNGTETALSQRDWRVNPTILSGDINQDDAGQLSTTNTSRADNCFQIVTAVSTNATAVLDGFTVTGGYHTLNDPFHASPTVRDAGGIRINNSSPTINHCAFMGNIADRGGAMMVTGASSSPSFTNCLFSGNIGGTIGGVALILDANIVDFTNCSMVNNVSYSVVGGIACQWATSASNVFTVNVENCLMWGNSSPGFLPNQDQIYTQNAPVTINASNSLLQSGCPLNVNCSNIINSSPLFVDVDGVDNIPGTLDDDARLAAGSAGLDVGNNAAITGFSKDLYGSTRIDNSTVDMGCYETNVSTPPSNCPTQSIIYVDLNASGVPDGLTWFTAYRDLQDALALADQCPNITEIWVAQGTYIPTTTNNRDVYFRIERTNLGVYGGFTGVETQRSQRNWATNVTILSGDIGVAGTRTDNSTHVVYMRNTGSNTTLDGFTITNGYANGGTVPAMTDYPVGGGGLFMASLQNDNTSPIIKNCLIDDNRGRDGAGVYLMGEAVYGNGPGGILSPQFIDSEITNNTSNIGSIWGGARCPGICMKASGNTGAGVVVVDNCLISNNVNTTSTGNGAGILMEINADAQFIFDIKNSDISNNTTYNGAAIIPMLLNGTNTTATVNVTDCNIQNNTSIGFGGAFSCSVNTQVQNGGLNFFVDRCIVQGNTADYSGSVLFTQAFGLSNFRFTNSIFTGNRAVGTFQSSASAFILVSSATSAVYEFSNSTICDNEGVHPQSNSIEMLSSGTLNINNSIIWNTIGGSGADVVGGSGTVNVVNSIIEDGTGGASTANPLFVQQATAAPPTLTGDYHLQNPLSPGIDAGSNAAVPAGITLDLDQTFRIQGSSVDMGAYETYDPCGGGNILYVNLLNSNPSPDGLAWATAYTDLQDALAKARTCPNIDQIWVAQGTYYPTTTADRTIAYEMVDGVAVYGGFDGTETLLIQRDFVNQVTILSGDIGTTGVLTDNTRHIVTANDVGPNTLVDGFTIEECYHQDIATLFAPAIYGGAIRLDGMNAGHFVEFEVRNCIIQNNKAYAGSGLTVLADAGMADVLVENCEFLNNEASNGSIFGFGGAILTSSPAGTLSLDVNDSHFEGNQSIYVGAVWASISSAPSGTNSNINWNYCTFTGNQSLDTNPSLFHVDVLTNTELNNCLISGNVGNLNFYSSTSGVGTRTVSILNSTIAGNEVANGEVLSAGSISSNSTTVNIDNSIIWGNTSTTNPVLFAGTNTTINVNYSTITNGFAGTGNLSSNPVFTAPLAATAAPTTGGDYRLQAGSPAIDGGNSATTTAAGLTLDLDGNQRIQNAAVDMGAYENANPCPTATILYVNKASPGVTQTGTSWADAMADLQDAIALANICSNITEIWVATETYYPSSTNTRSESFELRSNLAIYGGFVGTETQRNQRDWIANPTYLSGDIGTVGVNTDNSYHVVYAYNVDNTAILDGFYVVEGRADQPTINFGAGLFIDADGVQSSPTIAHCYFTDNTTTSSAGAVYSETINNGSSTAAFDSCQFISNTTSSLGGNLFFGTRSGTNHPTMYKCEIGDGSALAAGGMNVFARGAGNATRVDMTYCDIFANEAVNGDGGGIRIQGISGGYAVVNLYNSIVRGNLGTNGGGIYVMSSNTGTADLNVESCTFSGNEARFSSGGEAIQVDEASSNLTSINSIFWGNEEGAAEIELSNSGNASVSFGVIDGAYAGTGSNNLFTNPNFVAPITTAAPTTTGDLRLNFPSSAFDNGSNANVFLTEDFDGSPRIQGAAVDRGAYEAVNPCPTANILYVNVANPNPIQTGVNWNEAFNDLQDALALANSCPNVTEIWVAQGVYLPSQVGDRGVSFVLRNDLGIYGGFDGTETQRNQRDWINQISVLSGDIGNPGDRSDNSYHIVYAESVDQTAIIDGFSIEEGLADGPNFPEELGAGMLVNAVDVTTSPSIANCTFQSNEAFDGGGIAIVAMNGTGVSEATLDSCFFYENISVGSGAGFYNVAMNGGFSGVTFYKGRLTDNLGERGAAITNLSLGPGSLNASDYFNLDIHSNTATSYDGGGCVNFQFSNAELEAYYTNCAIWGNITQGSVTGGGGGMYNTADGTGPANVILTNCTFSGNEAADPATGSAIHNDGPTVNCTVQNCILWEDNGGAAEIRGANGANLVMNTSIIQGVNMGSVFSADPLFTTPVGAPAPTNVGDLTLQAGSPAINQGNNAINNVIPVDLGENVRIQQAVIDFGAYESPDPCPTFNRLYVDINNGSPTNSGSSWADALTQLEDALALASICSNITEIWVAQGIYNPTQTNDPLATFSLRNNLKIYGSFAGTETSPAQRILGSTNASLLSGYLTTANSIHVVTAKDVDNTALLDGFYIGGGRALTASNNQDRGAGIFLDGTTGDCSPRIANCWILDNEAEAGAGVFMIAEKDNITYQPEFDSCQFSLNVSNQEGGAIWMGANAINGAPIVAQPSITECQIFDNESPKGAGMVILSAFTGAEMNPYIFNCYIRANIAAQEGGGIYNQSIFSAELEYRMINCVLSGNVANVGAGIYTTCGSATTGINAINCTFSGNEVTDVSSIETVVSTGAGATDTLTNCILWDNDMGVGVEAEGQNGAVLRIDNSIVDGGYITGPSTNIINSDPLFFTPVPAAPTRQGDLHLGILSPAVDVGDNSFVAGINIDLDGLQRINGPDVDFGAFEGGGTLCGTGNTLYVDANIIGGTQSGQSWVDAIPDLQIALALARLCPNIEEIWVAQGDYFATQTGNRNESFDLVNGVKMYGGFVNGMTSINQRDINLNRSNLSGFIPGGGGFCYHVVTASNVDFTTWVNGFYIQDGQADGPAPDNRGGGVYIVADGVSTDPIFDFCNIRSSEAILAGGNVAIHALNGGTSQAFVRSSIIDQGSSIFLGGGVSFLTESGGVINGGLNDCEVINNVATHPSLANGGAISINAGGNSQNEPSIVDCHIQGNQSASGGGIGITALDANSAANVIMTDSYMADNIANGNGNGGGISASIEQGNINLQVYRSEIFGCGTQGTSAGGNGGAICAWPTNNASGNLSVYAENNIFRNNFTFGVGNGGGVAHVGTLTTGGASVTGTYVNCVFTSNLAEGDGGGAAYNHESNVSYTNCTFHNNEADNDGNVFWNDNANGLVRVENVIIWGNNGNAPDDIHDLGAFTFVNEGIVEGGWANGSNIFNIDPQFSLPAQGPAPTGPAETRLLPGSPAINLGNNALITATGVTTDAYGGTRIQAGTVDFGAHETPGCTHDVFEPNNSLAAAASIPAVGVNQNAVICNPTDEDWFEYITPAAPNDNIRIKLLNLTANFDLEVYDAAGSLLAASNLPGPLQDGVFFNGVAPGTVLNIRVFGVSGAASFVPYSVQILARSQPFTSIIRDEADRDEISATQVVTQEVEADRPTVVQEELENRFLVYPNPTESMVTLQYSLSEAAEMELAIFNQLGQRMEVTDEVMQVDAGTYEQQLDVSGWARGVYHIQVRLGDEVMNQKLVVK